MKKSEKLFLAINEIDDKIVDEAKCEEQKPVRVQFEKRMPIKEIIAFAACFAVLAVGIFALVKFKLNDNIDPVSNDSSDSSYDSSDQSSDLQYELELMFSEQDLELQAILKELVPNAEEIDGMFTNLSAQGDKYTFKIGDYYQNDYYLIPNGQRTANGLLEVPQSCDEMKQLISRYFSEQAAEFYMNNVCHGIMTANADGTYNVEIDSDGIPGRGFFEINGGMYFDPSDREYLGMGIDCKMAKVKRKTDNVIEFMYWGKDHSDFDGEEYAQKIGMIVKENGSWKLHYFFDYGFTSAIPAEYTEEDIELQEILETLKGGDKPSNLFLPDITNIGTVYNFVFPESPNPESNYGYIDLSSAEQNIDFPSSYENFEQQLLQYFSREATDKFMTNVGKGTMTETPDGKYSVTLNESREHPPEYIYIDEKLFYATGAGGGADINYFNTAKLIERTDNAITYSYAHSYGHGDIERIEGKLVYERGGWKRDPFYNPEADKNEFQEILSELLPAARDLDGMFTTTDPSGEEYVFVYSGGSYNGYKDTYYLVSDSLRTKPNDLFAVPQSRSEMEELLLKYFSKRAVKSYMNKIGTGSMTKNPDGTYTVTTEDYFAKFIEIDGLLYCRRDYDSGRLDFDQSTANVVTKTDKSIKFKYTDPKSSQDREGVLVYENGGWKLNYFYWGGFISGYPTEFTDEDEELQAILNELSPGRTICEWCFGARTPDRFDFHIQPGGYNETYFLLPLEEATSDSGIYYPQTLDELEQLLLKYFTRNMVNNEFMSSACKGIMTENPDGSYTVTLVPESGKYIKYPIFLEIDGRMYSYYSMRSVMPDILWDTARVIEKTDSYIKFKYIETAMGEYYEQEGLIKLERGGWRLNMNDHGEFDIDV